MKSYGIYMTVRVNTEAENEDNAFDNGQKIINLMHAHLEAHGIEIEAEIDNAGIEEMN
jgi:hypothetical protein